MSKHRATIAWQNNSDDFAYATYDRTHTWTFEGGIRILASGAPQFLGNQAYVNPEEAFVASLSSCHMLTFLSIASRKKYVVNSYIYQAEGYLEKNDKGKLAITRVILNPKVTFIGEQLPTPESISKMHELSHEECFIANSVITDVSVCQAE